MNRKQKLYAILTLGGAVLTFDLAQAQSRTGDTATDSAATPAPTATAVVPSQWLSLRQIYDRLEAEGYTDIIEIEQDNSGYEARATDRQGRKTKLYIEPRTGDVLKTKIKRH